MKLIKVKSARAQGRSGHLLTKLYRRKFRIGLSLVAKAKSASLSPSSRVRYYRNEILELTQWTHWANQLSTLKREGHFVVETRRLVKPADDFVPAFPGLNFRNRRSLVSAGERLLLVDPTYIADVYNSTDEIASFLRDRGLFLMDFGGDTAVPVWWKEPFLVMPISMHQKSHNAPTGAEVLTEEIGCDSGSFVFLPLSEDIPRGVKSKVKEVLEQNNAVALRLPAGRWNAFYEQFEAPQANMVGLYRNIVLKHSSIEKTSRSRRSVAGPASERSR